ncbi:MAG: HEPN domain-containing protein [Armatimonadota bacterium]|nr:HEPN domain-containing protein [Armatimonadota bacterium]
MREVVWTWVRKAKHDLRTAEATFTLEEDCPFDMVCFRAQQCAEKYLKALLVFHGLEVPRTHDLTEILPLLSAGVAVRLDVDELVELNPYPVGVRYPGLGPEPGREEARRALEIARRVRAEARSALPMDELT